MVSNVEIVETARAGAGLEAGARSKAGLVPVDV